MALKPVFWTMVNRRLIFTISILVAAAFTLDSSRCWPITALLIVPDGLLAASILWGWPVILDGRYDRASSISRCSGL